MLGFSRLPASRASYGSACGYLELPESPPPPAGPFVGGVVEVAVGTLGTAEELPAGVPVVAGL